MNKKQKILLIASLLGVFFLVYLPHLSYHLPFHVDEWKHIAEAQRLQDIGNYFQFISPEISSRFSGLEIGFHFWLFLISNFFDLIGIYKFLPAIWAVFSALALFFVVYKKSSNNFNIAILSVIFFASIKSDVNLTGIWFYTPLSFSIPFIYLYLYFFSIGIDQKEIKYLYYSAFIMLLLVFFHPLSVLFSLPIIFIYSLVNYRFFIKEWKNFIIFGIAGIIGVIFFSYILQLSPTQVMPELLDSLKFKKGWGMLELNNSLTSIYNWLAIILAILGGVVTYFQKELRKYLIYVIWPLVLLVSIIFYRFFGVSYIAPFQRNLYYLAISLPILSAIGLNFLIESIKQLFSDFFNNNKKLSLDYKKSLSNFFILIFYLVIFGSIFNNHYYLSENVRIYGLINEVDYQTILYTKQFTPSVILTTYNVGSTLFAISGNNPIAAVNFYGDKKIINSFNTDKSCDQREKIVIDQKVDYIIWPQKIDCSFVVLLEKFEYNHIYKINLP
jgi:hypothetical protein